MSSQINGDNLSEALRCVARGVLAAEADGSMFIYASDARDMVNAADALDAANARIAGLTHELSQAQTGLSWACEEPCHDCRGCRTADGAMNVAALNPKEPTP